MNFNDNSARLLRDIDIDKFFQNHPSLAISFGCGHVKGVLA